MRDSTVISVMTTLLSGFSHIFFERELEPEVTTGACPHALTPNKVAQVMWGDASRAKWQ